MFSKGQYAKMCLAELKLRQTRRKPTEALTAYLAYAEVVRRAATK